jgi:hypothetical protein
MPTTTSSTTLLESVNIVLANLGEAPVPRITGGALPQQVTLALNTIEEVSADIQSKGWWYNQQDNSGDYSPTANITIYPSNPDTNGNGSPNGEWNSSIPEEARRYITIRAARVAQTRFIGSEDLQKFSFNEELVSLAILQQAHVRNSNGVLDFNDFPDELKGLGVDEVMFLQGNVEEKIGILRLGGELANTAKTKAETQLIADQEALVTQQVLTEAQETIKRGAEAGLVTTQQALVAQQVLDSIADVNLKTKQGLKIDEETDLLQTQDLLTSAQKDTEVQNAIKVAAETGLVTSQQALVAQQVLDTVADTALKGAQKLKIDSDKLLVDEQKALVTKQVLTEIQNALKVAADTGLVTTQQALIAQQTLDVAADIAVKGKQETLLGKQALDVEADTALKGKQGSLIDAQAVTEAQNAIKVAADAGLVTAQQALISQQTLDVAQDTILKGKQGLLVDAQELKTDAEKDLLDAQKTQLEAQTAIQATAEKDFFDNGGVSIDGSVKTYRDFAAEMRIMGIQESSFQQLPAYKKVELIKDAKKLRDSTATETGSDATELSEVNKVMRLIGESPVSALNSNSLASECVRLLRDTDTELQGRGWWFNTEKDVELSTTTISNAFTTTTTINLNLHVTEHSSEILSVELNDYKTRIITSANGRYLYDLDKKSYLKWQVGDYKGTVIYKRTLLDTPTKYLEYLNVRVAILLTELYPQSGIDIQRLPKMEQELRAYFKDREFDEANYSIFGNHDTASRIGINRNYELI